MISWLSGVQANEPSIARLSDVNCIGSPPVAGTTYRSSTNPGPLDRRNAIDFASGENTGDQSLYSGGGDVTGTVDESINETNVIVGRFSRVESALTAKYFPAGDHENLGRIHMCS